MKTPCRPDKAGQKPDPDHPATRQDHVNTDQEELRDDPPDILLNNDKILDALLIRRVILAVSPKPSWPSCLSFPLTYSPGTLTVTGQRVDCGREAPWKFACRCS